MGDSLTVTQSALIINWFIGKELAFAFGVNVSVVRIGSAFNSLLTPILLRMTNSISIPLYFTVGLLFITFISGIIAINIDK